jgi:hypothetical protein
MQPDITKTTAALRVDELRAAHAWPTVAWEAAAQEKGSARGRD